MTGPDLVVEFFFKDNDKYLASVMRRIVDYTH